MKKKSTRKKHQLSELEAILLTPPDNISYYLREGEQFEHLLIRLENEAESFLKKAGYSTVTNDIARSLNGFRIPYKNEREHLAAHLLLGISKLREALKTNDARKAAIETLIIVSAATHGGIERIIPTGMNVMDGWSKGGGADKKAKGLNSLFEYGLKESPDKRAISIWRFLKKHCLNDTVCFQDFDIEFDEAANKFYQYDEKGKSRSMGFRSFQNALTRLKKK